MLGGDLAVFSTKSLAADCRVVVIQPTAMHDQLKNSGDCLTSCRPPYEARHEALDTAQGCTCLWDSCWWWYWT